MSQKISNDPDFIALKRHSYSLTKLMERYPDGAPSHIIASALGILEDEVEVIYQEIIQKLQVKLGVDKT